MLQLHFACFNQVLMHSASVLSCSAVPLGNGAFIEAEGCHYGLGRAAMYQQSEHQRHHVYSRVSTSVTTSTAE